MNIVIFKDSRSEAPSYISKVYSRGRVYATRWAGYLPSKEEVKEAWRKDKKGFLQFNESTNTFIL